MGSLMNGLETGVLDHITGGTGGTVYVPEAANLWVALWVGDPLDTGAGGVECAYTNYARRQIDFNVGVLADRKVVQNGILTFPECGATGEADVDHYVIYDTEAGTEQIAHGSLNTLKNIIEGNTPSVASAEIEVSINTGKWSNYLVKAVLDWIFCQGTFTTPDHFIALASAELLDTSTGTSLVDFVMTDYAREQVIAGDFDAATEGDPSYTSNATALDYGALTDTPETITAIAMCDAITNGNLLMYDNTPNQLVGNGDTVQIPIGDLDATFA